MMPFTPGLFAAVLSLPAVTPSAGERPARWQDAVEVASGAGVKGPWRQNDSRYDYVDDPTVALDPAGNALVAWVDQGRKDVLLRRFGADGAPLGPAVDVSRSPATFSWLPRVVAGPNDAVFLLWQEIIFSGGSHGGDILFARSTDGGRSFAEPINLSRSVGGDGKGRITPAIWHNGSLDLALAPDGSTLYAAWTEYDGALWFSRSRDGGRSFSAPDRVEVADAPARAPALAAAPDGALYLAWTPGTDPGADIQLSRSEDGGRSFRPPLAVAPDDTYSDAPKLAVDAAGVLHLAYAESRGGPFERRQVRYARSRDGGRSVEPPRALPPAAAGAGADFPALRATADGTIQLSWEHRPGSDPHPRGLGYALSCDGGESFGTPVVVPGSVPAAGAANGGRQGLLMQKLAADGDATALVNSSFQAGQGSRVWLLRGQPGC